MSWKRGYRQVGHPCTVCGEAGHRDKAFTYNGTGWNPQFLSTCTGPRNCGRATPSATDAGYHRIALAFPEHIRKFRNDLRFLAVTGTKDIEAYKVDVRIPSRDLSFDDGKDLIRPEDRVGQLTDRFALQSLKPLSTSNTFSRFFAARPDDFVYPFLWHRYHFSNLLKDISTSTMMSILIYWMVA